MPYLDLPGVQLWYNDSGGDGVPVVLMHAASGTADCWVYQLPAFTAAGYRCIAYDRRGWGRSRIDPSGEQPGYASDDLHGLLDHLGLGRVHLVATAAGGAGAMDYTLTHPERVRSVVVADAGGGLEDADYLEVMERISAPEIAVLPVELREVGPSYRGSDPEGTRRWVEIERASHPEGGHGPRQGSRSRVTSASLATLEVPVLAMGGEADLQRPPALVRMFSERVPNCQFATIPEAGHAAFWEQPAVWNRLVLGFIGQH